MKPPPDKRPSHKTVKTSLKSVAKNDVVVDKLAKTAIMVSKIVTHALQLLKLFHLHQYDHNLPFPKLTRAGIRPFMKIVCKPSTRGAKPSEATQQIIQILEPFYKTYYQPIQGEELNYLHLNAVLDYLADSIVVMYHNNITQRFVSYVEKLVNVHWKKRETIHLINKFKLSSVKRKCLVQKLTLNLKKVKHDILYPNNAYTSASLYHDWINEVRKNILPSRPLEKESVFYDLVCHPEDYLRGMVIIMREVENAGYSISNCFPLRREVKPKYVPIDTMTLVYLLFEKQHGKKDDFLRKGNLVAKQDMIWNFFFHTQKKIFHSDIKHDYQFANYIQTDGVGISILLVRKDLKGKFNKSVLKSDDNEKYIHQLDSCELQNKTIVAVDPNKSDLIYCYTDEGNKTFRYTQDQRRKETKFKKYRDIRNVRRNQRIEDKTVIELETELSEHNSQTLDFQNFLKYIKKKNEINRIVSPIYQERIFRKLKLGSFFLRQQTENRMLNKFEKMFGSAHNTIIGFGDFEQKHHMKFKEPVKGKEFRNLLRKKGYEVYLVDEFRTSCRCSHCEGECKTFRKCLNPRSWKRKSNKIILRHGLLLCQQCKRLWNRDYNASRNIYKVCVEAVNLRDRPQYLQRSVRPVSDATSAPSS